MDFRGRTTLPNIYPVFNENQYILAPLHTCSIPPPPLPKTKIYAPLCTSIRIFLRGRRWLRTAEASSTFAWAIGFTRYVTLLRATSFFLHPSIFPICPFNPPPTLKASSTSTHQRDGAVVRVGAERVATGGSICVFWRMRLADTNSQSPKNGEV